MSDPAAGTGLRLHRAVPCIGCSLMCDDLDVAVTDRRMEAGGRACDLARDLYRALSQNAACGPDAARIGAQPVAAEEALNRAAATLSAARLPLVAALDTDVAGVRAALRLAEQCGAVVDTFPGEALFNNVRVLQTEGWLATTIGEARNRADILLVFGTRPLAAFPRLLERLARPLAARNDTPGRRHIYLVGPQPEPPPGELSAHRVIPLRMRLEDLAEFAGVLASRSRGQQAPLPWPTGLDPAPLDELAARVTGAGYPVLVWSAAEFDFPHADLTVQRLVALAQTLSEKTRCTTLALSHCSSAVTAQQVSGWYCGFPPRVSFTQGAPCYDPHGCDGARMLARGDADALLWISAVAAAGAPTVSGVPRIVLGSSAPARSEADIFLRIGVPGVDHGGQMFRSDGVALGLRRLRESAWPSAAQVLEAIRERCA